LIYSSNEEDVNDDDDDDVRVLMTRCTSCFMWYHSSCNDFPTNQTTSSKSKRKQIDDQICRKCFFMLTSSEYGVDLEDLNSYKSFNSYRVNPKHDYSSLYKINEMMNEENITCCCEGPCNSDPDSMFRCFECKNWFHKSCILKSVIKNLKLKGDGNYKFTCPSCSYEKQSIHETFEKIPIDYLRIIYLIIYNLMLNTREKYFTSERILDAYNTYLEKAYFIPSEKLYINSNNQNVFNLKVLEEDILDMSPQLFIRNKKYSSFCESKYTINLYPHVSMTYLLENIYIYEQQKNYLENLIMKAMSK